MIPEGVTELNNSALIDDTGLVRVVLPESLTAIWDNAFRNCRSLKELTIPSRVEYIDDEAFTGCTGLRTIYMRSPLIKGDLWLPEELRGKVRIVWPQED
ncbi:MAG: leucine-rich repeat domain-containing protein [Firmicutes bacterium]|nr:leucine-rich repeat domain-containing protein [Bacillota bacterium]MBQ6013076.1 leucine-rich repeat domain-containing protein [Bacillota bacterium]MBQ6259848.1 leucine-rich repeat domain-containing protein [Bacillota bacterium]MBR0114515.1 leucine-rich repeat domain-containing protein [Bacillota bacterium]MBR0440382.1 leucine-rich repeat domain-containing protein [Bacillota bacterium]